MENIFRCGCTKIHISQVAVANGFIRIEWTLSENKKAKVHTTICHVSKIELQKTISRPSGDLFEVNGVQVTMNEYMNILTLLLRPENR